MGWPHGLKSVIYYLLILVTFLCKRLEYENGRSIGCTCFVFYFTEINCIITINYYYLRKSKSNNHTKSGDMKRCSNGGNVPNSINFGTFFLHLKTGITQCKRNARVPLRCHHKANGPESHFP